MAAILKRFSLVDSATFLKRAIHSGNCRPLARFSITEGKTGNFKYITAVKAIIGVSSPRWREGLAQADAFRSHAPIRSFAQAAVACLRIWGYLVAEAKDDPDTNMTRFARYMAICMMIAVGVKVLPSLGRSSVEHAMMLMESEDLLFKKSGINRVRLLAKNDSAAAQLLERGIAKSLVDILDEHQNQDPAIMTAAMQAIEELSRLEIAREALVIAGVKDILEELAANERDEGNLARSLLVCYTVQKNHVD